MRVEVTDLLHEAPRVAELIQHALQGTGIIPGGQQVIRQAPHPGEVPVEGLDSPPGADDQNPIGRRFQRGARNRQQPAALLLRQSADCHVLHETLDAQQRAVRAVDSPRPLPDPTRLASLGDDAVFVVAWSACLQRRLALLPQPIAIIGVDQISMGNTVVTLHLAPLIAGDRFTAVADKRHRPIRVIQTAIRHSRKIADEGREDPLALEHAARLAAQLQLRHHLPAQYPERLQLGLVQLARHLINDAQRAKSQSARRHQRSAGVEADARFAGHQWIVGKPFILHRVGHHEQILLENGVPAKRIIPWRLVDGHTELGLEPLPVLIDERDEGDGSLADMGGQRGQVVQRAFRERVEQIIAAQRLKTKCFIRGARGGFHANRDRPNANSLSLASSKMGNLRDSFL